jgi:Negative regulator of sigma F
LLLAMLRRGHTLQPGLTAVLAGFAAAAAAATLLVFFHPYDASATDLVVHVIAVGLVIVANRVFGGRLLRAAGA